MRAWVGAVASWTEPDGVPKPALLPAMLRRRTSLLTRVSAELLSRLQTASSFDLATIPTIHGSAFGEIKTTLALLDMMFEGDGALSPTRFHNSVHNTAAGYVSIATGNRRFSTSIAAGRSTVMAAMLEALTLIHTREPEVVVLCVEEPVPAPFTPSPPWQGLGVGLHLTREPGARPLAQLTAGQASDLPAMQRLGPELRDNPCASALELRMAIDDGKGRVALDSGGGVGWYVDVQPVEGSP